MEENYSQTALEVRRKVLDLIFKAQTSHIGSNFSCIDLLTVLHETANITKDLPEDRDRILYSKGWVAASAYVFLNRKEILGERDLETYCREGSDLIGLVEPSTRGIEAAGGSMGYGLPFGVGFALSSRLKGFPRQKTYVLMSDGEMAIGTTWESALLAAHHQLKNLIVIVDLNGFQAMGRTEDVLDTSVLGEKWEAFGWEVREVDGHDYEAIEQCLTWPRLYPDAPLCIIAKTIKGKGVSFMENNNLYHYKAPNQDEYDRAKAELDATR